MELLYYNSEHNALVTLEHCSKIHEVGTKNRRYTLIFRNNNKENGGQIFSTQNPNAFISTYNLVYIGEV